MRVAVIGAGFIGAAIAHHAAQRGAEVVVLEAEQPCAGASGHTFSCLNVFGHSPSSFVAIRSEGIRELQTLANAIECPSAVRMSGTIRLATEPNAHARLMSEAQTALSNGVPVQFLSASEVRTRFEPALNTSHVLEPIIRVESEGWADLPTLVARLLSSHGIRLVANVRVNEIDRQADGRLKISADKLTVIADMVVIAAGTGTPGFIAALGGGGIPVEARPGVLITLHAGEQALRHVIYSDEIHVRPELGGGEWLASMADYDLPLNGEEDASKRASIIASRVRDVLVCSPQVTCRAHVVGVRPTLPDGLPAIGPVGALRNVYAVVTHGGATLGALLARWCVEEMVGGNDYEMLAPYRLDRFAPPDSDKAAKRAQHPGIAAG
jgi:glycine/D-amino acid oxidase-like deaminating enzyme